MELFIRDYWPHGLAKRTVVTTKHKNVGRTRVAIAVAAVLVVPALLNMLTNEVLCARHPVPGAFPSSDTFSQHFSGQVAAKFLTVLEAVSDCLCHAVNSNRNAINSYILDSLCQCLAGESDEAQFRPPATGFFALKSMAIQIEAESSGRSRGA